MESIGGRLLYLVGWTGRRIFLMGFFALLLGLFVSPQATGSAALSTEVPNGSSIDNSKLDGVIGDEWRDSSSFTATLGSHSTTIYTKHDSTYWYIALTKQGRFSGPVVFWIWFDADDDRQQFEAGDDLLEIPVTNGQLATNIDYAYTAKYKATRDTQLGGTDDKAGASRFADNQYVFEVKIELNSGDRGSRGNDIALAPCQTEYIIFGLIDGNTEHESTEYAAHIGLPACSCAIRMRALAFCQGSPIALQVANTSGQYCDFFSCSISPGSPSASPIASLMFFGLNAGGSASATWNQTDSSGRQVAPGIYCLSCQCRSAPLCFQIVNCRASWPSPFPSPPPIPEPPSGERPPSPGAGSGQCQDPPVFSDSFDNSNSGWPTSVRGMGYDATNKEYYIAIGDATVNAWAINNRTGPYGDFCYGVRTRPAEGPDQGVFGIVFRYQNDDNFYLFTISSDGYFSLHKRVSGMFTPLISHQASSSINKGRNTNHLHVTAKGREITLFANNQQLATVSDDAFSQGRIGLFAAPGMHVRFDDVKIRQLR